MQMEGVRLLHREPREIKKMWISLEEPEAVGQVLGHFGVALPA